jgi:hypothetical protein
VLDQAARVGEVELAILERQASRHVGLHERAGVFGLGQAIHAGDVELRGERPQAERPGAQIDDPAVGSDPGEVEETFVTFRTSAGRQRRGEARAPALSGGCVDICHLH